MIIPVIGIKTLEDYKRKLAEGTLDDRPTQCPCCLNRDTFWKHGSYKRRVVCDGVTEMVRINRYACGTCGQSVSCLFSFLVPYRQFLSRDLAESIERIASSDTTYLALAVELNDSDCEPLRPSCSQVFRWIDAFSKKASRILFAFQKEAVMRNSNLVLDQDLVECPAATRSRNARKRQNLHEITEFVLMAKRILGQRIENTHAFFLSEVETLQSIFSSRRIELPTPQSVQRLVF